MLHFSTDRLAGLDNMILKVTAVPGFPDDLGKQRPRPPLAAASNILHTPQTSAMLLHALSSPVDPLLPPPGDFASAPDPLAFRPLPPLPSPSPLHLPSFLDFSTHSSASISDPPPRRSAVSLPPSALFRVPSPDPPSHRPIPPKSKVYEGPQWIPAFHHPNSPYVPWSSPVRQRILPPPSPLYPSSPHIRPGAVAPEPWASPTFPLAPKSGRERLSSSWRCIKRSIKKSVKSVASRLGSKTSPRTPCTHKDTLSNLDDTATNSISPSALTRPRDSLASLVSSDSITLATWLAERRATAIDNAPKKMSVEEYELVGSWLDLRHSDGGWLCGIQDCDMHTAGGSPHAARGYPMLCLAMPFDSTDLLSLVRPSSRAPPLPFPAGPFSPPPRCHSLPRLPCQSFDLHSAQRANSARCHELSMPGGWSFN